MTNVLHFLKSIKTKQSDNPTSRESSSDEDEYPLRDEVHDRYLMGVTAKGITNQICGCPIDKISNHLLSHGGELLNETDSNCDDISDLEYDVKGNMDYSSLSHDTDNELHPLHMFRNIACIDELANDMLNKSDVSVVLQKSTDVNEGNVESISINAVQKRSQFIDGNAQGVQSSINNGGSDKCDELVMNEMQSVIGDSRIAENDDKVSALVQKV